MDRQCSKWAVPARAEGSASPPMAENRFPTMNKLLSSDRKTIVAIADEIGMQRSALRRYLDKQPAVQAFLGAEGTPPTYPADTTLFQRIKDLDEQGVIKPSTLPNMLSILSLENAVPAGGRKSETDQKPLVPFTQVQAEDLAALIAQAVQRGVEIAMQNATPPAPDAVLSRLEAATLLHCHPDNVSRLVEPLSRGRYSRAMCLRHIEAERLAAEERQAARTPRLRSKSTPPALPPSPDPHE